VPPPCLCLLRSPFIHIRGVVSGRRRRGDHLSHVPAPAPPRGSFHPPAPHMQHAGGGWLSRARVGGWRRGRQLTHVAVPLPSTAHIASGRGEGAAVYRILHGTVGTVRRKKELGRQHTHTHTHAHAHTRCGATRGGAARRRNAHAAEQRGEVLHDGATHTPTHTHTRATLREGATLYEAH
jgi:hypothetical protein